MHVLIAFAGSTDPFAQRVLQTLKLPHLERALAARTALPPDAGTAQDFAMPHERTLVKLLADAAQEPTQALITPCHWQVGQGQVIMGNPDDLALTPDESMAFLAAMQPYFLEDGISLSYEAPLRWRAQGEVFRGLPCASLDRVIGQNIDDWLTHSPQAHALHRLQNEMQMLLYTHPLNDARSERGQKMVNSFWVSASLPLSLEDAALQARGIHLVRDLATPALVQDWTAWGQAWQALDAQLFSAMPSALPQTLTHTLTLCGSRHAQSWMPQKPGIWHRFKGIFNKKPMSELLSSL
jgi:hypothetical protein